MKDGRYEISVTVESMESFFDFADDELEAALTDLNIEIVHKALGSLGLPPNTRVEDVEPDVLGDIAMAVTRTCLLEVLYLRRLLEMRAP